MALLAFGLSWAFAPPLYELDSRWPRSMPSDARGISAVAVNHTAPGKEIYVSQRGTIFPQPILVFDGSGALLRSWGADSISNGGKNGTWGGHGINLVGDKVWVYDIAAGAV